MIQEYWVVGGSYRDANFAALKEGTSEVYGPFVSYDEALSSWNAVSARSRAEATTRFSIVVTAPRR
jgi:hypothetical protein